MSAVGVEAGLARAAETFWAWAGGARAWPRPIESAVPAALPASVEPLADLTLGAVRRRLRELGLPDPSDGPDRALRGCLAAAGGAALLFVDERDPPDERRFTIAHEAAHLLLDYLAPRERAIGRFGAAICAALDGQRPASPTERIDAALARVSLAPRLYLLDRDAPSTTAAESRADRLALELLAPFQAVVGRLRALPGRRDPIAQAAVACRLLRDVFGLPPDAASGYATRFGRATATAARVERWLRPPGQLDDGSSYLGRATPESTASGWRARDERDDGLSNLGRAHGTT